MRVLQQRIASGEWPLNSRIPTEAELVEQLGVGRSTVREAVRTLAHMGMLEPAPSRGTFVRSLVPVPAALSEFMQGHSVADLVVTRRALELEATRLAATRRGGDQLAALRAAHEADVAGHATSAPGSEVERGSTPGQFHGLLMKAAGSPLLLDLHSGVLGALRGAVARGQVRSGQDAAARHADHGALLDAIEAADVEGAVEAARAHLEADLRPTL